jgi:hypothetical protein
LLLISFFILSVMVLLWIVSRFEKMFSKQFWRNGRDHYIAFWKLGIIFGCSTYEKVWMHTELFYIEEDGTVISAMQPLFL